MKDLKIMRYIPESKQSAVREAFHDNDGYWIYLNKEWNADNMDKNCTVISQDTIAELRYQIAGIRKFTNEEMKYYKR